MTGKTGPAGEMKRELLISRDALETRVAVMENGRLAEYHVDRPQDRTLTGNIYKARVARVLPGMQSAFVDYGEEKTGFLFIDDAHPGSNRDTTPNIGDLLRPGQEILVQVEKEPGIQKGAKVTTNLSLPGRYAVLFPGKAMTGISHRIGTDEDRSKLKTLLQELCPPDCGLVARTAANEASREELERDVRDLASLWEKIRVRAKTSPVPGLIHGEQEMPLRVLRDFLPEGVDLVVCDDADLVNSITAWLDEAKPARKPAVEHHGVLQPLSDRYGLEDEIASALSRRVWLRSGGYLVIDHGEALTAIDVNTGKNTGKNDFEETITRTNLEAAAEIARQLRLRNTGGIVVIDFIDMKDPGNREKVRTKLSETLALDRARCTITGISDLGLLQMTRKRVRDSLSARLEDLCPCCEGTGKVLSAATTSRNTLRQLRREISSGNGPALTVQAHPSVVDRLTGPDIPGIEELEKRTGARISFKPVETFHPERFDIVKTRDGAPSKRRLK